MLCERQITHPHTHTHTHTHTHINVNVWLSYGTYLHMRLYKQSHTHHMVVVTHMATLSNHVAEALKPVAQSPSSCLQHKWHRLPPMCWALSFETAYASGTEEQNTMYEHTWKKAFGLGCVVLKGSNIAKILKIINIIYIKIAFIKYNKNTLSFYRAFRFTLSLKAQETYSMYSFTFLCVISSLLLSSVVRWFSRWLLPLNEWSVQSSALGGGMMGKALISTRIRLWLVSQLCVIDFTKRDFLLSQSFNATSPSLQTVI